MEDLLKARAQHNLDRQMRVLLAPKVLIVDEFGIWPHDRESATAFFTLVSARPSPQMRWGSIILTSDKGFGEWGELLGDTVIASAVLDRLLHHSHVLNIPPTDPRRELPAQRETPGGAIPVATTHYRDAGGGRRQLRPTYQIAEQNPGGSILARRCPVVTRLASQFQISDHT